MAEDKKKDIDYSNWLIRSNGSLKEPWTSPEELLELPAIKAHNAKRDAKDNEQRSSPNTSKDKKAESE